MATLVLLAIIWMAPSLLCLPHSRSNVYKNFQFVTREQWGARPRADVTNLNLPVPFVVIHHTYIPVACFTLDDCAVSMRHMQNIHMNLGWGDIGYSFAVGSDGKVYEGRGWDAVGAHSIGFNSRSIGIALIGNWVYVHTAIDYLLKPFPRQ